MNTFKFQKFSISQEFSALKLGTDAVILGTVTNFNKPNVILDIGTGTGILSIMMAQKYNCEIHAIDIDEGAIRDAKINFENCTWKNKISLWHTSLRDFSSIKNTKYDGIICNPPYFSNSLLSKNNSKNIARHSISLTPEMLFEESKKIITENGKISIIIPYSEKNIFIESAQNQEIYTISETDICPFVTSVPNRIILQFSQIWQPLQKNKIEIRKEANQYTTEFKSLTQDFYINHYIEKNEH